MCENVFGKREVGGKTCYVVGHGLFKPEVEQHSTFGGKNETQNYDLKF